MSDSILEIAQQCIANYNHYAGSIQRNSVRRLYLPDGNGELQPCGLILEDVALGLPWELYGFWFTDDGKIVPPSTNPNTVSGLLRDLTWDEITLRNFPDIQRWVNGANQEYVNVIGAHPAFQIPDYLGAHIGIPQVGAHLTIFSRAGMWVQVRSSDSVYPGKYDQIAAGGVRKGETFWTALYRLAQGIGPAVPERVRGLVLMDGIVSYTNIRDEESVRFVGQIEPGIKACFSVDLGMSFNPEQSNSGEVSRFILLQPQALMDSLKGGMWRPSSALVALYALARNPNCIGRLLSREEVEFIEYHLGASEGELDKVEDLLVREERDL